MKNTQIQVIEKKVTALVITAETMPEATEVLSRLNQMLDKLTIEKEKLTQPLNATLKEIRSRYKESEVKLETAINTIRSKMSEYQTAEQARITLQERQIAKLASKGTLTIDKAVARLEGLDRPIATVSVDSGSLSFVTVPQFEIINFKKLPDSFKLPNEVEIRKAQKANINIPGVRFYTIQSPRNSR